MPELPEVEVARRNLERWWVGRSVQEVAVVDEKVVVDTARAPVADPYAALARLEGATLRAVTRRAKLLRLELDTPEGPLVLLSHFKMTGKFVHGDEAPRGARACFRVARGPVVWFADVRRFGWLMLDTPAAIDGFIEAQGYGPEPWPDPIAPDVLRHALQSSSAIKPRLLDQSRIAGLGNIAASEILFRARIHPHTAPSTLDDDGWRRLSAAIHAHLAFVLEVEEGDEIQYLSEADAVNPFLVYGREGAPCPECDTPIERERTGGRPTFWCSRCQIEGGL